MYPIESKYLVNLLLIVTDLKKNTWENSSFIAEMYHLFSHLNSHFVLYT